ncbi:MAG: hypothetical protein INR67_05710 [Jatrophihabitans endophyticus]|nr:hypothetical protein [Jatrophihabitans endophyticus]
MPAAAVAGPPARGARHVAVPAAGRAVNTDHPDRWVGHGTPSSCTSTAFVAAVAKGGIIRFRCGPKPVTIHLTATAKLVNTHKRVVIDGRDLVTLDGGGRHRILYLDTCDPKQTWTTSHCQDQSSPTLIVQNLTFAHGNSSGHDFDGGGGGAVFDRGGQLRVVHSRFVDNRCEKSGPDLGGGAVRALSQFDNRPVYVTGSTFTGNRCSNGAGLSSIGVSWDVLDDRFTGGRAEGHGANPARKNTKGGGSGGAIYTDGDRYTVRIAGTTMTGNHANEGGGAVFFVSNDRTGTLTVDRSTLERNVSARFQTQPGIFFLGRGKPRITHSIVR